MKNPKPAAADRGFSVVTALPPQPPPPVPKTFWQELFSELAEVKALALAVAPYRAAMQKLSALTAWWRTAGEQQVLESEHRAAASLDPADVFAFIQKKRVFADVGGGREFFNFAHRCEVRNTTQLLDTPAVAEAAKRAVGAAMKMIQGRLADEKAAQQKRLAKVGLENAAAPDPVIGNFERKLKTLEMLGAKLDQGEPLSAVFTVLTGELLI